MRAIIQRVKYASVEIESIISGRIELGLLVLAGWEENDTIEDLEWMSGKISRLRIFSDAAGQMNLCLQEVGGDVLLVSQFTLHASTKKGNRPSYIRAARPEQAIDLYRIFIKQLEKDVGKSIQCGRFGADMKVSLLNDGPVTIYIDSKNKE